MNENQKHKEMTKGYFNNIASSNKKLWSGNIDKWCVLEESFKAIPTGGKILECGSGSGMYTIKMLQKGFKVTAVDISGKALELIRKLAKEKNLDENLVTVEAEFEKFADELTEKFDAVVYFKTLHHFPDLKAVKEAIEAGYGALTDNGLLLGLEPNGKCPFWQPFLKMRGTRKSAKQSLWEAEKGLLMITKKNLEAIFEKLEGAKWRFRWPYVIAAFIATRIPFLFNPINRLLEKTILKQYSFNMIFEVRKR